MTKNHLLIYLYFENCFVKLFFVEKDIYKYVFSNAYTLSLK